MGFFFGRQGTSEEQAIRSTVDDGYANIFSNILKQFGLNADLGDAITSWLKSQTGEDLTNAQKAQNQFNAQQAELQRQWEEQMANTQYQRGVADMQAAGLNPALAYSQGGAPTPQGSSASNGMPQAGGLGDFIGALLGMKELGIKNKVADADVKVKEAEADKITTETSWIDRINQMDLDLKQVQKELTFEQKENAREIRDNIKKEGEKLEKQVQVLEEQKGVYVAEQVATRMRALVSYMSAYEIQALLASKKALLGAQTAEAGSKAKLNIQEMKNLGQEFAYKAKLYENEAYVDAVIDQAVALAKKAGSEAEAAELEKKRKEIRQSILSGEYFDTNYTGFLGPVQNFIGDAFNGVLMFASDLIDASLGQLF